LIFTAYYLTWGVINMSIIILAFIAVILDKLTKIWAVNFIFDANIPLLKAMYQKELVYSATNHYLGKSKEVLGGLFKFTYVENKGMAWGMFSDNKALLISLCAIILVIIIVLIVKFKPKSILVKLCAGMVIGGAIGNVIDRLTYGFVIDFIDINLFNYPVFNVADCFIVIGAILFCIHIIFFDKKKEK